MNEDRSFNLYTVYGKRMIKGRQGDASHKIRAIYGFIYFSAELTKLWIDTDKGNPYALWWLNKVNDRLNKIKSKLDEVEQAALRRSNDGLEIAYKPNKMGTPVVFKAHIQSPYSWEIARLIKRYDEHCLTLLKQNSVGLISDDDIHIEFKAISKLLISCMSEPVSYQQINITAQNIINNDSVYEEASTKMGIVPKAILNGDKKPDFLPQRTRDIIYKVFINK